MSAYVEDACGLSLLLTNQRWIRERFGEAPSYLTPGKFRQNRHALGDIHQAAPSLKPAGIRYHTLREVAEIHVRAYQETLGKH